MSWSIMFIGNPENIVKALENTSTQLSGASKEEYDAALPHLTGLVKQNFSKDADPVLKISASGHGYSINGEPKYNNCQVTIENLGGTLV